MINWERVTELREEIGAEDFGEVADLFLEEADEVVARLPTCIDANALENALHYLKGAALNLGFADLANLCQEGERLAASGDASFDRPRVALCYEQSKDSFKVGMSQLPGACAA